MRNWHSSPRVRRAQLYVQNIPSALNYHSRTETSRGARKFSQCGALQAAQSEAALVLPRNIGNQIKHAREYSRMSRGRAVKGARVHFAPCRCWGCRFFFLAVLYSRILSCSISELVAASVTYILRDARLFAICSSPRN